MTEEKIIDKIRALLAKTEANGCTAEESESAWAMAQRLMAKHAIDEARLAAAGHAPSEAIIKHTVPLKRRDEIKRFKLNLFVALAKANHCKIIDATETKGEVWIIGHESDAQFVEIMAAAVMIQYASARTREWKAAGQFSGLSRHLWVKSFAYGYVVRIGERLREAQAQEQSSAGAGTDLVLASRGDLVKAWVSDNLVTHKKKSRAVKVYDGAASQGASAANRADLSGGRNNVGGRAPRGIGS